MPGIRKQLSPLDLAVVDSHYKYLTPPHLRELNKLLLKLSNREIKRLAVFIPPRHGKSKLISEYFPAWYLASYPEHRVILSSYEADFAATWGYKSRNILEDHGKSFNPPVYIDSTSSARNRWDLKDFNGGMVTAGVGGPVTGKGADLFIIDDPVKNADQANSRTYREKAKDWYRSTVYTRLEPEGVVILIQTRWHVDDLGGWILENSDEEWTILNLPAINNDGQALWPERFDIDRLLSIKKEIGSYWFNALYQQSPQPPGGGLLKKSWISYYNPSKIDLTNLPCYTGWDLAISSKDSADYTTSCTIKYNNQNNTYYVVDWTRNHLSFLEQQNAVINQHNKWNTDLIGIETVGYQAALPQSLGEHLLPLRNVKQNRDKITRIQSAFTLFEQQKILLPQTHNLLNDFIEEYTYFPTAKHDDLLDATEIAINIAKQGHNPYTSSTQNYHALLKK